MLKIPAHYTAYVQTMDIVAEPIQASVEQIPIVQNDLEGKQSSAQTNCLECKFFNPAVRDRYTLPYCIFLQEVLGSLPWGCSYYEVNVNMLVDIDI